MILLCDGMEEIQLRQLQYRTYLGGRQNNETLWIRRKLYLVGKVGAGNDSVKSNPSADTVHYCVVRSKDY